MSIITSRLTGTILYVLSYDYRSKVLGIWSLEERRNRADLLEVFKMNSGLSAIPFDTLFEVDIQQRTRGHTWKIFKHRSNLDVRKYSSETAPPAPSLVGVEELPAPSSRDALFPKAIGLI